MTNVKSYVIINEYNEHISLLIIIWIYDYLKCPLWVIVEFNNNIPIYGIYITVISTD